MGKIMALDIALNNPDRFPITQIWHNSVGNAGNVLFMIDLASKKDWESPEHVKFETVVAIDNQVTPITQVNNESNFNNYWKTIDQFVANLLTKGPDLETGKISNVIPSLNKFLYTETVSNYTIKPREEFRIVQGILLGFVMLASEGVFSIAAALQQTADASKDPRWLDEYNSLREH